MIPRHLPLSIRPARRGRATNRCPSAPPVTISPLFHSLPQKFTSAFYSSVVISNMIRHAIPPSCPLPAAGGPARRGLPAQAGGAARPCACSVFSVISATFVLIPALSSKNLSFVFICLRTLSFSVSRNPFVCHSYENNRGGYQQFPKWNSPAPAGKDLT